jgi:hypothetical protein
MARFVQSSPNLRPAPYPVRQDGSAFLSDGNKLRRMRDVVVLNLPAHGDQPVDRQAGIDARYHARKRAHQRIGVDAGVHIEGQRVRFFALAPRLEILGRHAAFDSAVRRVRNDANNLQFDFSDVVIRVTAKALADRVAAEVELVDETLVDDSHLGRTQRVRIGEVTASDQRNRKRLEEVRADFVSLDRGIDAWSPFEALDVNAVAGGAPWTPALPLVKLRGNTN